MNPALHASGLDVLPGPYIRRLHQISVALFTQETQAFGVTPVQYGALLTVSREPGLDQRTLAERIGLDTSTTAGVVDRLESRGWLRRRASPADRRVKLLDATPEGLASLADMTPQVMAAQARMLAPLGEHQAVFMGLLRQLVNAHTAADAGPSDGQWPAPASDSAGADGVGR